MVRPHKTAGRKSPACVSVLLETLEVSISFRVPDIVKEGLVAGAGFEPATFGL